MHKSVLKAPWLKVWEGVEIERQELEKKGFSSELELVRIIEEFIKEQVEGEDTSPTDGQTR